MKAKVVASTKLRENLADILDAINKDQPVVIISRRGKQGTRHRRFRQTGRFAGHR